ncbi:MAG: hypothetical protein N2035_10445 [Chthoniobacterales bacterium]|nr:hypothetical protein [Chthoniobacterales bacterium]
MRNFFRLFAAALLVALVLSFLRAEVVEGGAEVSSNFSDGWRTALPGWKYEFPRDHFRHSEFKTEWWYFTGNLRSDDGKEQFGFQLTFFRHGIRPQLFSDVRSAFAAREIAFAHFAISDFYNKKYFHTSRWARVALGGAFFPEFRIGESTLVSIHSWRALLIGPDRLFLEASDEDMRIELELVSQKPPIVHGRDGVSQKADGAGRASHYYSLTRLKARGWLFLHGRKIAVSGQAWYDHEWATNQLTAEQVGWDWFCLQFEDGTELMLFQIRRREGGCDPNSSATFVYSDGRSLNLTSNDFLLEPLRYNQSKKTGAVYPLDWKIQIPSLDLNLIVLARMDEQEFTDPPIIYWEGAIHAEGKREGRPIRGFGYLEMTGYGSAIVGMQAR